MFFPQVSLGKSKTKVILFLIDQATWDEIKKAHTPHLDALMRRGAVGLISPRTVGAKATPQRAYLTVGAGNRADATLDASKAFNALEPYEDGYAKEAFMVRTGTKVGNKSVVHLGVSPLLLKNNELPYGTVVGALGERLKQGGFKTAVIGNSDTGISYQDVVLHREAVLIAMDMKGKVDYGDVGKDVLLRDKKYPFGVRTNDEVLFKRFKEFLPKSGFMVIDYGDTSRASFFSEEALPEVAEKEKIKAIERVDRFIGKLVKEVDLKSTTFIVASFTPPNLVNPQQLTPLIMAGKGIKKGYLTSATTSRKGIVSNVDIAPTILELFSLKPSEEMIGRGIYVLPANSEARVNYLISFNHQAVLGDEIGPAAIIFFIVFQLLVFVLVLLIMLFKKKVLKSASLIKGLILSVMAFPLVLFLLPNLIKTGNIFLIVFAGIFVVFLFSTFALLLKKKRFAPLFLLSFVTFFVLACDLFLGGTFHINSILGYSPIVAGRFYGVGNEGMSILVVCSLLAASSLLEDRKKFTPSLKIGISLFFALVTFIIGFPALGANFGGTLTAVAAFSVTYLLFLEKKIRWKEIFAIAAIAFLIISLFVVFDTLRGAQKETHLGRSAELVSNGGAEAFKNIVERKVLTNIRVLKYSSWSYLLLAVIILLSFLRFKPQGEFKNILAKYKYLASGLTGALVASAVGFLVNDSGIAIPALIFSYFSAALFYLIFSDYLEKQKELVKA